jgi:hypothetical protein
VLPGRGAVVGDAVGQAATNRWVRARRCSWPPLRPARVCCEHESVSVVCLAALPCRRRSNGELVRSIGLDVHRDFCEVAIAEDGRVRSAGRIETSVETLGLFARSLGCEDAVVLEATSGAAKIAKLIEPYAARVVVANTRKLAAISQAKAKTDRLDARTLARLLASGYLEEVWAPGRADQGAAAPDRPAGAVGAGSHPREERGAWGVGAQSLRPPACGASVQQGGAPLAGRPGVARRRAADARGLSAPDRLPRRRDPTTRGGARPARTRVRGDPAADDGSGGERAHRRGVRGQRRGRQPVRFAAPAGQLSRARSAGPPVGQRAGPPRPHLEGRRCRGQAHARRGRLEGVTDTRPAARFLRAGAGPPRPSGCSHRHRSQAGRAVLAPAQPRAGLCVSAALDDPQQAPPARTPRRCSAAQGQGRRRRRQIEETLGRRARAAA